MGYLNWFQTKMWYHIKYTLVHMFPLHPISEIFIGYILLIECKYVMFQEKIIKNKIFLHFLRQYVVLLLAVVFHEYLWFILLHFIIAFACHQHRHMCAWYCPVTWKIEDRFVHFDSQSFVNILKFLNHILRVKRFMTSWWNVF